MTEEMCDKVVNTHSSTTQFLPESYKTKEMFDEAFNDVFLHFLYY